MHDRVWQVPEERFVEAWNAAGSIEDAAERVRELAGGKHVPRWAVMARAVALRKTGVGLKPLGIPPPRAVVPQAVGAGATEAEG
ncbi:MAG TPA: hypothetical protein VH092_00215 [Urbifossiella sp.]|jgi:hypothetical protein|nr:hypothetical protein [Urbifossiella sp.]